MVVVGGCTQRLVKPSLSATRRHSSEEDDRPVAAWCGSVPVCGVCRREAEPESLRTPAPPGFAVLPESLRTLVTQLAWLALACVRAWAVVVVELVLLC